MAKFDMDQSILFREDRMTDDDIAYLGSVLKNLSEKPNDAALLIKAGRLFFEPAREPSRAVACFQQALTADPSSSEARFWMATCLLYDYCDYQQAKHLLTEALHIKPNMPEALSLLASVMGELDEPPTDRIDVLRKALALAPDWALSRLCLARLLIDTGKIAEAKELLANGLETRPDLPVVNNPLDEYYEQAVTGRAEDGWTMMQSMIEEIGPKRGRE